MQSFYLRTPVALLCCELLLLNISGCGGHRVTLPTAEPVVRTSPLEQELRKSYLTLFEIASTLSYSDSQIQAMQEYLKQAQDYCVGRFESVSSDYQRSVDGAQQSLKKSKISEVDRHSLHCKIQDARALKSQADVIAQHAIPVAYDNKQAKLELIQKWPAQAKEIQASIADGTYKNRRWGDVEDIGFREIESNQKDDIKTGQEAIRDLKRSGLMPKELEDKAIVDYVSEVAKKLATNSDLQVPLQVTVLNSKEINAFALPGGFVFVERGILEAADDESQLAGVIAHEMSHVVARHGHKLMTKATIASIVYQAAQIAAVIFTGGVASIGAYYALQYGFYGLGLTLSLTLLGVSREYEQQADQLGIQYSWKAGYDPSGYIRFFDKMATREGYVNGASWFRSHPPFYQRMVESEREMDYLGKRSSAVVNTAEFKTMKEALAKVTATAETESKQKPSLLGPEQGCPAPSKLVYEPDQPIETICSSPKLAPAASTPGK
ncbi:MAG TPA: M48 family metalloprotease [Bryobacteraceae bacterium]|nr:M48 family metalloprotease [Bryobacteraceae bacterium]